MSVEQQIEELRAELSACWSRREARQIEAELRTAMAEYERLARAFSEAIQLNGTCSKRRRWSAVSGIFLFAKGGWGTALGRHDDGWCHGAGCNVRSMEMAKWEVGARKAR